MTRTLIVGSTAAEANGVNLGRDPKDLDVFTDSIENLADSFWHESFGLWLPENTHRFATLDELYTIKVSHSYWDLRNGSWEKHMSDQIKLKTAGAKLDLPLHDLLYGVWIELHGAKRVNLNMNAADFFADAVKRIYDHDSIHYSVAYGDRPLYEEVLKDGQEIMMDMKKVWALPFEKQIDLFREEVYATALERWVIPSDYTISPRLAYARALKRTITSLTKGRSARFMSEHYDIFRAPSDNYVARHLENKHKLIPLEG